MLQTLRPRHWLSTTFAPLAQWDDDTRRLLPGHVTHFWLNSLTTLYYWSENITWTSTWVSSQVSTRDLSFEAIVRESRRYTLTSPNERRHRNVLLYEHTSLHLASSNANGSVIPACTAPTSSHHRLWWPVMATYRCNGPVTVKVRRRCSKAGTATHLDS